MAATPGVEPGFALMAINKPPPAHPRRRRQRGDVKTVLSSQTARQMNLFNRCSAATAGIEPALFHYYGLSCSLVVPRRYIGFGGDVKTLPILTDWKWL